MKRSKLAFEATFGDLDFLQKENLKRARLRLNITQQKHCALPVLKVRVLDDKSGQIYGDYTLFPKHSGVNTLVLTKSLQKLASSMNPAKRMRVRITTLLRNPNPKMSLCSNVVSSLSEEAYLVTNTDEVKTRKRRSTEGASSLFQRNAHDIPSVFRSVSVDEVKGKKRRSTDVGRMFRWAKDDVPSMSRGVSEGRSKRSNQACTMKTVWVDLTGSNSTIFILPNHFKTGVCGLHQPVPLSSDPMIQALAAAIARTIKSVATSSNPQCCMPAKLGKLTVLYLDSVQHTVLRQVKDVVVKSCACSNNS